LGMRGFQEDRLDGDTSASTVDLELVPGAKICKAIVKFGAPHLSFLREFAEKTKPGLENSG